MTDEELTQLFGYMPLIVTSDDDYDNYCDGDECHA